MKIKLFFELSTRDEDGNIDNTFGLAMTFGETEKEIDYRALTASVNKEGVLRAICLDGIVKPEDVKIITPEEYDEEYGGRGGLTMGYFWYYNGVGQKLLARESPLEPQDCWDEERDEMPEEEYDRGEEELSGRIHRR